ncbi:fibropellin-1-like isoform X1 [Branchiostoma floridae]|uniref:Fibropellin-1-like isoform X1 n=1 Tax=Branchiostoma floridae TaxID=7739 RepID=A0A9J7KZH4_BRAFL|nr:fibropellin-1-like isoform X1 [Branchiostoma floridae]
MWSLLLLLVTVTSLPASSQGKCCGDILREATEQVDQSSGYRVPDGWTLCYIDARDAAYHDTPCVNLLQGIPGYGDAQGLLAAGGNFGCWHGNTGGSPGPAFASNSVIENSCRANTQHSTLLSAWATSTTTLGVCINGITCDDDECISAPCQNGATCQDGLDSFTCLCAPGYNGTLCETEIDECSSSPCQNGATCQDGVNSFTCQCAPGYAGTLCETDIDECASSPCLGGGTCVDHVNSYSCVCPKGHVGDRCETVAYADGCLLFSSDAVSYPEASQECQNRGGHLVDVKDVGLQRLIADSIPTGSDVSPWIGLKMSPGIMTYADGSSASGDLQWSSGGPAASCELCAFLDSTDGYLAQTGSCSERKQYVCRSDPEPCAHAQDICFNNGACTTCFNGSYTYCTCPLGYEGVLCNMDIDECASNPCQNGATCLHGHNNYYCHCSFGYEGHNCQGDIDLCAEVSCPFDWKCEDQGDHFICLAGTTRMAEPYSCSSASCPNGLYCKEEGPASFSCRAG